MGAQEATSIHVTDDILSYDDGATAEPRIIEGPSTGLAHTYYDGLAYDPARDILYTTTNGAILVFDHASTATGDIAPTRRITIPPLGPFDWIYSGDGGLEVDPALDRLYLAQGGGTDHNGLFVLENASTLDGPVEPPVWIPLEQCSAATLDPVHDLLYVTFAGLPSGVYVFAHPATLTSTSTPSRTVVWPNQDFLAYATVDSCHDRLYLSSNGATQGGYNLFAFNAPDTLDGAIDLEADSDAQLTSDGGEAATCSCSAGALAASMDSGGRLYTWPDGSDYVDVFDQLELLTGASSLTPQKRVHGVHRPIGLGIAVSSY